MEDVESTRVRIIRSSRRIIRRLRRLIDDTDSWNENYRPEGTPPIDIGKTQLTQLIEYHELVIQKAKAREIIPDFNGDWHAIIDFEVK